MQAIIRASEKILFENVARRADAVCLAMGQRLHRCDGGNRWIGMVEFGDGGAAVLAANIARMGHGKG
jgi:hypothetical protein